MDGVLGETMLDSALPSLEPDAHLVGNSSRGSWRGHMNAIQEFVHILNPALRCAKSLAELCAGT